MIYNVLSGQVSSGIVVSAYDEMYVLTGGTAKMTVVSGYYNDNADDWVYGNLDVRGVTSDTTVNSGRMCVSSGGRASSTVMNGGELFLVGGGAVVGATVNIAGYFDIESGGSATAVRENGGFVLVEDGAAVTFVSNHFREAVLSCNSATLHSGTTATQTTLKYEGQLEVHNGGVANSTTLTSSESYLYVSSGGRANHVDIAVGDVYVEGGGVVKNVVVGGSDGWLNVFSGGRATGTLRIADGGHVSFEAGSILDFDISALAPGGAALVDKYSLTAGTPDCTITVSEEQKNGKYVLADKVAGRFAKTTLTVYTDDGTRAGTITVGGSLNVGKGKYTLAVSDDQLVLTLSGNPVPKVISVAANVTAATNKNVTVTATFSGGNFTKQYSLDNKTWKAYTTGVVMTDNGKVYFREYSKSGVVSEVVSYEVANIDRVPPAKPSAKASVTTETNRPVTVTATFSTDSVVKQCSLDNKTWKTYTSGVVLSQNGTVYFRGVDEAGNVSAVTSYTVTNILPEKLSGSGKAEPGKDGSFTPKLSASGRYVLTGTFTGKKGSVTVLDGNNKKVASGTARGGVIALKEELLLDNGGSYTVVVKNTDKKSGAAEYTLTLDAKERFTKGDNSDDTFEGAKKLVAGTPANDWVGYGDAADWYKLGVDARGGIYDLDLSGVGNNVRLTVYSADGRKIKSVSASAKKPAVALANLCLADGSYAAVEAPKANKALNSDYTVKLTRQAVFTGGKNNDWSEAVVLKEGDTFTGALTKAPGGDFVDYCDVSTDGVLSFEVTSGKAKVSFFDEKCKAVKIDSVRMANGSVKMNVASLTLTENSGRADFSLAALGTVVKFMKIEASGKTLNGYTITNIA